MLANWGKGCRLNQLSGLNVQPELTEDSRRMKRLLGLAAQVYMGYSDQARPEEVLESGWKP